MTKRILLYAALYGGIGAIVGVMMALYTKDAIEIPIVLGGPNHSAHPMTVDEPVVQAKQETEVTPE